jgi:hypothetical protein
MDAALLNPSKYIKAIDFKGKDVMLTIATVAIEELEKDDNTKEKKGVITFRETTRGWVLNVTNVKCMVKMWGRETDDWIDKRVVLYPEPSDLSESGFAIRVRGSPDLEREISFILKLARKKPRRVTLKAYGKANGNGAGKAAPTAAAPTQGAPEPDEEPDEIPEGEDLFPEGAPPTP